MTDRFLADLSDDRLGAALRELSPFLAAPTPHETGAIDPARRARLRIEQAPDRRGRWWPALRAPRLGRGLVLALLAILVVAAAAAAIGLGLPGIRIVPAPAVSPSASVVVASPTASQRPTIPPTARPTPSGPLGSDLGLGDQVALTDVGTAVDFPVILPAGNQPGPPTTAWLLDGRLALVWRADPNLPPTEAPGIGLILEEFRGSVDEAYFEKVLDQGTTITNVEVGGDGAYWISGRPHEIVFVNPQGQPVWSTRRSVGDTLLWTQGDITYRLESGLGLDASIALAESLR